MDKAMCAFAAINSESVKEAAVPATFKEAVASLDRDKWISAIKEKLESLHHHRTYKLTDLPSGRHAVGSKWIFKIKRDSEGKPIRYKAQLVAQGFIQRKGLDFQETFAPVARMTSQRIVIATAAAEGLELFQIDVANTYLNRVIDTQIYMCQSTGFKDKRYPNSVWELLKGLYGLKQAGNIWNAAIYSYILEIGFTRTFADLCVYTITFPGEDRMIIAIHVDNFLIASNKECF
jgi:hypothetical protein